MPSELLSEQLVILLLILAGGFVTSTSVSTFNALLGIQARVVGQEKLGYFYDLVGYSMLDRVDTYVVAPAGTAWIEASGTTLTMDVNGTIYIEHYAFQVTSPNITGPACLEIEYTGWGVLISGVTEVDCAWQAS